MGKKLSQEEVENRIKEFFNQQIEVVGEYITKRDPIKLHCLECDYYWEPIAQSVLYLDKNISKHHCPNCGITKRGQCVKCSYCGKEIFRSIKEIEKNISGHFYCSRECGNRHKNILRKLSGEWDNGLSNYRLRAMEFYKHECLCCGWDEDERILEVHHIDEDRNNNHISNLCILCPTCHRKITLGYYRLDLENKKLLKL